MTYNFDFNSRETYIAFRADWRGRYKAVSEEIRAAKRKMAQMKGQDTSSEQYRLHVLRTRANNMMLQLAEAKEFKAQQMAALTAVEA